MNYEFCLHNYFINVNIVRVNLLDSVMEFNREEAVRARRIALKKLERRDFSGAQKVALQVQRLYPELENLSQLLTVCKVCCALDERINRQLNWYGILQVEVTADDTVIRKQYDELVFWLHPNKNKLPGAEAAFKLVSEAHTILCDNVKRSRYDVRRQATHLSEKALANRSGVAGHVKPYDFTVVFWTICPHCQKRFVYYQRNFLVTCDNCGKNFFAFKFDEQAMPSKFLSAAANNSQVSQEMVFCQHVVPDQLVCNLHATGGSMDSMHTDEPMKWAGISDGYGEDSSETRSNIVQCSAVNKTHSSSPSADKGTAGSLMLESPDPEIIANQNLCGEDASTVLNSSGPCIFQRLCKRKQDDCTYSIHSRHPCNDKRQSKHNSLSDNVPGADNQAAKHLPSTVDSYDEGNATHEGRQQKYKKEAKDTTNQMHVNPAITYECSDSGRNSDSCNNKRQRREENSLADANPSDSKMYNDNVAGTDNQAGEHVPSTVESQTEINATQEGSQQNHMEGTDIADQLHGNPVITYECADRSCSMDFCHSTKQRKDNSLADVNVSDDKMHKDNVTGTENQVEQVLCTVDSQDDATHEGSQQMYKKERTGITDQMHGNPEINYKCTDFFDFLKLRDFKRIAVGQIWAVYDDHDLMPRVYAQINHIDASNLKVQLTWLEHNTMNELKSRCTYEELPVACGNFCLGETYVLQDPSMYLSHIVSWTKGKNSISFEIHPKKGEVWAVYKESSMPWNSGADNCQPGNYDVVEVSGLLMYKGIIVYPLVRIEGFVSLFAKAKDKCHFLVPLGELFRFSHSIPCYRTNGKEKAGVSEGFLELDTAALPCDFATSFSPINIYSLDKRSSELVAVSYPDSEFHNFDEDRSCEKFQRGQIWALYSNTDILPNLYGWLSKVETQPFKVHLTWLKPCPQEEVEKLWLEQDIPISCGNFEIGNSTAEFHEKYAFSHIVSSVQSGTDRQVKILPKVGEVWAIYDWSPDWVPSRNFHRAEYAIGEIIRCTEGGTLFAFLTKVDSHVSVFKHDARVGVLEILTKENRRFSHRIPSFRLTEENGGELRGLYELDPAAVVDIIR